MCGIAAILNLYGQPVPNLRGRLDAMGKLLAHRGPDGAGTWVHPRGHVGLAHRRLSIIDIDGGAQPMQDAGSNSLVFNGEIYNYRELRRQLGVHRFTTLSDTETILVGYRKWGARVADHLRGMFAFVLWDETSGQLLGVRDRFGMKPLYHMIDDGVLYLASEAKALLPFVPRIRTDIAGMRDYLAFQLCLGSKTMFEGIQQLEPGQLLETTPGAVRTRKYWDLYFEPDWDHTDQYMLGRVRELMGESINLHLRADVPLGAYLSGGVDSSLVASLASKSNPGLAAFTGRFLEGKQFDESSYALDVAREKGLDLHILDITSTDFVEHLRRVIYQLDYPVAGPGSFPQFMVAKHASRDRKVLLGGQGGDEIFGGYARYLIAYLEQCLNAAIDGTMHSGTFVVTYESIIPNLKSLRNYKPLLKEFWAAGLFDEMDDRYFRLISRSNSFGDEVRWNLLGDYSPIDDFRMLFNSDNTQPTSYFDRMTHFDLKTLLPALLHVEDRVSMAHGVESRLPFLDHPLVEFTATMRADTKFLGGEMKRALKAAFATDIPAAVLARTDKMGFPTPLVDWAQGDARDFVQDVLGAPVARDREFVDNRAVLRSLDMEQRFGRGFWGFLSLELWQQEFHDRERHFKSMVTDHMHLGE